MATASRLQRTIASDREVRGVGFFLGSDVILRFRPAAADTGIIFVRTDLPGRPAVRAHVDNVIPSPRRTTIRQGDAAVSMIEHVMAALAGLNVDNCVVELDAAEPPGCDGSSRAFVDLILDAGIVELDRTRQTLVIEAPVTVRDGLSALTAHPGDGSGLVLSYHLDYGRQTPIGTQSLFLDITPEAFAGELAGSRTFLLESEADALRKAGIGTRVTNGDLLVFGPDGVLDNELRFPDECVRHKILDMVGDLALLDMDIQGHVVAHRSGHALNASLVRELVAAVRAGAGVDDDGPATIELARMMKAMPGRSPFLMIDAVDTLEPGVRALAHKVVRAGEPYLQTARDGRSVVPGMMILEALTQAAGLLISGQEGKSRRQTVVSAIDRVTIGGPVGPGDRIVFDADCLSLEPTRARVYTSASVAGRVVASAEIQFVLTDADRSAA